MAEFKTLWDNHVGVGYVCDRTIFRNQCAMRMGQALADSGITLEGKNLRRCADYSSKFSDHEPGHIRSAQQLANVFYRNPRLLGAKVKHSIFNGSINKNLGAFRGKKGMIFIKNGWGNTDHIDLWDGTTMKMKGTDNAYVYRRKGEQVWFWEIK